ncbi:MAG TPA: alpha/beta hydrolase [Burkholderiales bacterium]|jgi:acetyl esterase|nr:alpha/beta hydrolase [Burkholderiales bacterium]
MSLDSEIVAWFERLGREFGPAPGTPAGRRQRYEEITRLLEQPALPGLKLSDLRIPLAGRELPARIYHPGGKPALLVFFHGGGWVTGSLATHDSLCQRIAAQSGAAVASVEYRLAPEFPFPAPCEDAHEALVWLAAHAGELGCDATRMAVGGDSAGAHLAAVSALTAREVGPKLKFQWLVYPTIVPDFSLASYVEHGQGPGLTQADMEWYWRQFLNGGLECPEYRASPMRAETLAGLPPAYVMVAGHDPLRDEGLDYADLLKEKGVPVTVARADTMPHGFARLFSVSAIAAQHIDAAIAALKEGLA